ncbi:nebulin [Heterodontus francisci]|uniref:nebulin n=1 Tax=Heterodontus francisci TaxID=7792 RepID=UPI00355BD1F0
MEDEDGEYEEYEEYEVEEIVTYHTYETKEVKKGKEITQVKEVTKFSEPQTIIREVSIISEPRTVIREISEPHTIIQKTTEPQMVIQEVHQSGSGLPVREVRRRKKIDKSKFMTPYLEHSHKMQNLFSQNKYKEEFEKEKGKPYAIISDTPELKRIRKAQEQLSEVKYRSEGDKAKTMCHVDGKARDIEHAKNVSQLVSKVLYKQKWEDTKDVYQLPPDAPELVRAVKFAENFSPKLYKEAWEEEKTFYYPYSDSPELRRVANAQKALSDIEYKKGHQEQISKYTSLADPPDVVLAKKVVNQLSDLKYHEDYNKNKGKWSQTPCYEVAVARMNADNLSTKKYNEGYEEMKDQIYFMQTETPEYKANKRAKDATSTIKYRADYEKTKDKTDYSTLPVAENPLLRQLKHAGHLVSDNRYKKDYEKTRKTSMNYCDTPKFKTDKVLTNLSDVKYKQNYEDLIKGHYIGSHEDPYTAHCLRVGAMKSDKNYKEDYEMDKGRCYFPQTITPEYEAMKSSYQCKDQVYKLHPDKIRFTQVVDSPVMLQAQVNAKQLSDLNYKADYEKEKFKCTIPHDFPFFIQSRVNAYNLSDNCYNFDWNKDKAKHSNIRVDSIPVIAAKAHGDIASDIKYKRSYEKSRGKHFGARSIEDDPKILHSVHVAKMQSEREYKKDYEKTKTKYHVPLDMINVSQAKKAQEIASNRYYKQPISSYFMPPDSVPLNLAKKAYSLQSDNEYKADYNNWQKGIGWVPYGSMDVEKAKKAMDILNEKKYRQPPNTIKFTSIDDSPATVLAKMNQEQMSDKNYKAKGEKTIHKYTYPPDLPEFIQAKVNAINASDNCYKQAWKKDLEKGYNLTFDAIPIIAAKSAHRNASDVKYKKAYEQGKGKHVGFRNLQDDPKLVHSMHIAKLQSDREYKKDYEKSKTKYHTPLDMVNITAAKKSQEVASNSNYRNLIHNYTYLPDAMSLELSKNMMNIQSDNLYKSDYNNWFKGIGWSPLGSIDMEKVKKAGQALNEQKYRIQPGKLKFTSVPDSLEMVLAKTNALQLNDKLYRSGGEKIKHKYTLPPDVPQFMQAKYNAFNLSDNCYKNTWKKSLAKGYNLEADAIPIIAAKASRRIASDYKYKEAYEKEKGKHFGFRSLQDDPKLVHSMHIAKLQSEREYKKDYEKSKTKYHIPVDMVNITAAKMSQDVASNCNYRQRIHNYTYLPDAMSVALSKNMMNIQSDNLYKQDYNCWQKGTGWIPIGSLDVEKVKKAGEALNEHKYRQHPDMLKFTSVPDSINMVLVTSNTKQLSELNYKKSGEEVKHKYTLAPDYPPFLQAKVNAQNLSDQRYKQAWHKTIAKGHDVRADAIPIIAAKASRNIASNYRYKEAYEKEKGKHVGFRSLQDDPKLVHSMHVAKMQSEREYKKDYEKSKTKYHTPLDMLNITSAKKSQEIASNSNYKNLIHNYTYLPDAMSVALSKNMMDIQSDNNYKLDYNTWFKGIGWIPLGSLDVEKARKATDIASEKKYRQLPETLTFTSIPDSLEIVLAKSNAQIMNKKLYTQAWDKDKNKIHVMPDTPEIVLSKSNQMNMSEKLYRSGWENSKKKGYRLMPDAISIKAAKATRDIASDYKYKLAYEKEKGKHIGFRSLQDDPKLVHFMHVAKLQSDREYKKDYEKIKTKYNTPLDMVSITAARQSQEAASNINYKHLIHRYTIPPDSMNLELARNMMNIQSDSLYKQEFTSFMKGMGWIPIGSLEEEKNKRASNILCEKKYRQQPETFKYTIDMESMPMELAKVNAKTMNMQMYKEAWEKDKIQIHVMPDTPEISLAKVNQYNMSQKMYRQSMEEAKKKGYDLRADAIPIKAAKASTDIASNYKYKHAYEKARGRHVGFRNLQDDPKLVHCMHIAKMQSGREYKKDYEKSKTRYHTPKDMLSIVTAKKSQEVATNANYRQKFRNFTYLPDAMNLVLSKKMMEIQSENNYKADLQWLKGIGWTPAGSLDVEKAKNATEIASDKNYRQHPHTFKFTSLSDSMDMVLAKTNTQTMKKHPYTEAWEKDKIKVHVTFDSPDILQAKANTFMFSNNKYKLGWEQSKKKGYDLRPDAISIKAAKASTNIASDYKYKTAYRKQLGHHVGFRSIKDDPKLVWCMHVGKMQSDREYKKNFEKTKTKFNMPVDMLDILLAKKCQTLVSDIDYRRYLHQWTCLPDQNDVIHAQKAYELQSDLVYKADLQWLKGIGWSPMESLDVAKVKKAGEILSETNYRQHPTSFKFTSLSDSMDMTLAKSNAHTMNKKLYIEAWEKDKTKIHVMPDTPEILLAKTNTVNLSEKMYKLGYEELKKKGYDLRNDAISIKAAKASRDIASDYKYKTAYRKQLGHHVGFRSIKDDPKLVWCMHVGKMQSDREYKKNFEKTKTKFNMPVDMLDILLAKKCQTLVSDIDYRRYLHQWTCLPDQNDVIQAKKAYELQSDLVYKADLDWLKGIGWSPMESLDVAKVKKAGEILSEINYRQHPTSFKFSSLSDSMDMTLAKNNAHTMNKRAYIEAWESDKTKIHVMPDTPGIILAKQNQIACSDKLYRLGMEESKKKGYNLRTDAISIKAAKASRDIASDYKYKTAYRKQLGHHVGCRNIQDDPKMVWSMHVAKIQSDREYKKDFEKTKTKFNMPADMLDILLAKKCQTLVSDIDYRHYLHQWTCLPDQNDVIQARKAYDLQSDIQYKADLQWLQGIGWTPNGSLDVEKVKKAGEILSEKNYRQPPNTFKFTSLSDSMPFALAKLNSKTLNQHLYTEAWERDKVNIHVTLDTPEIVLASQNKINYSDKQYRLALEESKKKGYDLRPDAISIKAAKASRDIASDYKYKTAYRKQLGHHVGFRSIKDDPKLVWCMHVGKMQSDREYKKNFEKTKTKFNMPVDMLDILLAKKCQTLVSDIDYRRYLHQWTCLPDQNDVIQAKKAYELQSDLVYKADLDWLKGIGWSPMESLDVAKVKKAGEILSEINYRQHPTSFKFSSLSDSMDMTLAKNNAQIMNKRAYIEAWEADKTKIHVMPDTPEIILARQNQISCSEKLYKLGMEEDKKKGYNLRADAISIKAAKASRDIASDYKYKTAYRKQLGHHVGCRNIQDDPKMVWSMHVAKIQSDREYKKDFEKTKTKFNMPVDMLDILLAKKCQTLVSDIDYRHYLHQWTCLPDQNDVIQAKKAYDLQSDLSYKSDLEWLRGIGWSPADSLDVQKVKKAGEILSEKIYRQPPNTLKFTSILDSLDLVLAKNNAQHLNKRLYTEAWNNDKTNIHVMPDTPEIILAKSNSANMSQKLYHKAWEESKLKGYDLRADAIPIRAAKASRNIASMFKYKEAYRKQLGHHVGCRDINDDPKMVWCMHVAKMQSDREYKKDFEKSKTKFNMPVDMLDILLAKKCQTLVSDIDYRHYLHQWTCLPDQNDVIQAKKAYELQSDLLYKSDLEWIRGCGWMPNDSLDVKKVQNAQKILSERLYRQPPNKLSFTSIVDDPSIVQAKINSDLLSDRLYRSAWESDKLLIHLPNDTPEMLLSKQNSANISSKLYKLSWEESKKEGYDLRSDAISIKVAKASRDIASDYKYKEAYRKQLGHLVGCRDINDDPKMVWCMHVGKMQSDREYKKDFEKTKTKFNMPVDMLDILLAKKCQTLVSDIDYRHYLHEWTCLPDQNDVIQAKKAYNLQSDLLYKSDLEWIRGCGWMPNDSLDVKKVQKAQEILSEQLYRQPPNKLSFTSIVDLPSIVQSKINSDLLSDRKYKEAWEKDKVQIHVLPDTPAILLAKSNAANVSQKLYKEGWEDAKKTIDYRADAIAIQNAKASRNIASDYLYKEIYRKQLGHHVGCRDINDDPKMVWCMHVGKMQSDREYKKDFEKTKTKFNMPVDMLDILLAKKCQTLVSDIDYRHYLHEWTCLPDQNDVIQAKKAYDLQSDLLYKSDLEWIRGCGWMPNDSIDVKKVQKAQEILSERLYRQPPNKLSFTSIVDLPSIVQAKINSDLLSDRKYKEAWEKDKIQIHVLPDTPAILLAKSNAANVSQKLYKEGWEDTKKAIDYRVDAIAIQNAKASRNIASDYLYKEIYRKQLGHHIGCRDINDDPKMVWCMHVGKMQSDREYKKDFEKTKTKFNMPVDMLDILLAKKCQTLVSDIDYRHYLHEWTCLPDQNDIIQAKKAYDLQSDLLYKSDLEWIRGCGWMPNDSIDVKKVQRAQEILSEQLYRQPPNKLSFTSIVDLPSIVQAKINSDLLSDRRYKENWEKDKVQIHVLPDTPAILLAKSNAANVSQKLYKEHWEDAKKTIDYRADAIAIQNAKASRNIASDYLYKEIYRKQLGHHIGCRDINDDPKMVRCMHVGKMQSDREYKKEFEKTKSKINIPVDMLDILLAKKCQTLVSDIDYRHYLHEWTCLPDQNDVIQAKKAYDLQSDVNYKSDMEWMRGIGWIPTDSVDVKKVKYAQDILSERSYRTKADSLQFTPVTDRIDYVAAKQSGDILNDIKYREAWHACKTKYTLVDSPTMVAARDAARNLSEKLYKDGWEKLKATGYQMTVDAVPISHAKTSQNIQSELKYKAEYAKQLGHHLGCRDIHDYPKMVWSRHIGKMQSDREYKKEFEKTKSKINIPVDMLDILLAKKFQTLVSEIDYRHYLHEWTCLPDQNDVIQAKKAYDLQSDFVYKSDLEWVRGCGWIPLDSVEHQKVKNAQAILNEKAYKENAVANFAKFTSITDTPDVILAKINSNNVSDLKYKETFNLEKGKYIGAADTPTLAHSREMAKHFSQKFYKGDWESRKAIGYTLPPDYLPLVVAKHADNVNSNLKYKELYEKLKGHYLAGGDIKDFPAIIQAMAMDKMRNMMDYRRHYEDTKYMVHIPYDMISNIVAKKCQHILSDIEYRTYLHHWTCLPDEHDVIHAKKAQEILSDFVYKDDLNWLKGMGCFVWDTPEILRAKQSYKLQSEVKYRTGGKKNFENYTLVTDTPVYVTAVQSGLQLSDVKYKENYEKSKDKYTTILDTVDYNRQKELKNIYSSNAYKLAWDTVKASSYTMPGDAFSIALAKNQKYILSPIKYREQYEKFKALYTLPRSVEDDPRTLHCLKAGKLNLDRLYRETYEKNKMKVHIMPDMLEVVTARDTQAKVSEIDYRKYLHEWTCLPDLQINIHAKKVNEQLSDILYKDDLNWLKGIGCNVWDTPLILHAKKSYDLQSEVQYKAKAEAARNQFTPIMDTPVYRQAVTNAHQQSDVVYHNDYVTKIRGKVAPTTKTMELDRARQAHKLQSENLYRDIGRNLLPTGYTLPADIPSFKHARNVDHNLSNLKYKEAYEHMKARGYTLIPETISITAAKKADHILNQRLYRLHYDTHKDKIHPTHDTPELRQVKATQEAISDLSYKSDYFRFKGQKISLPITPELLHHRYVGIITSDNKYKEDLRWLKGIGCFLYGTPEMIRVRDFHKFWTGYDKAAKKIRDKHTSVLDTPEHRHVTELKTHLSNLVYRAHGNEVKTKYTTRLDTVDLNRAKHGQKIQSQYLYVELATKARPHYTPHVHTTTLDHAKHVKHFASEKKYKEQYEKMKSKYTSIPDTPMLLVSKKAYIIASDLRYKEAFEHAKGHYRTVKDALNITYHRKVTDDISQVKYKEKYIQQLGLWRSIPDPPEHFHHRMVTDAVSTVKYKEDLGWLRGIGCYAWDTPDLMLAGKNKELYSQYKYQESVAKFRNNFKYTADTPNIRHAQAATAILDEQSYKSEAKLKLRRGCNEILRPDMLTAIYNSISGSQWNYKKNYEKVKDKYTSIYDTPDNIRSKNVTKLISDIKYKLEYNQNKSKGYTTIHDTPMLLHMRSVKDKISALKYRENYERNKANCNIDGDAFAIRAAKSAYKNTTNLDYKKKYEATKAKWLWIADRPDFVQAYKASQQQSDVDYKLDRESLKGCKISVPVYGDKNMILAVENTDLSSGVKYKLKHEKERGIYQPVPDTPQMLHAKSVATLMSEKKYKEAVKKELPRAAYMKLPETRGTSHVKEVSKLLSGKLYKEQFEKDKGKSSYSIMVEPPEVKHAMNVAKCQSNVEYKKEAKSKLAYTSVVDRPDILKATEAAKLISDIGYRTKAREEASRGIISLGRPDIELAKEVSKLTSQVEYTKQKLRGHGAASYDTPTMRLAKKANILTSNIKYKEKFNKEFKGKRPKFDLKESSGYKTMKDANILASEVIYKQDLKKMHKPVTDMSESLQMQHNLSTSKLSSQYQYKKEFEKSKGHYQLVSDSPEQIHLKDATELQSQVKYKEKYEKERGKAMLDFETPVYLTAKETQHMQSEKEYKKDLEEHIKGRNLSGLEITPAMLHVRYATKIGCEKEYRRDLEEGVKGKGLTVLEETPEMMRARNATYILNEKEYKRSLEEEIKGKGLVALANETPDFARAKNATDILSQVKYKHLAEMDKSNYTSVIDTPDIIHAQNVKNLSSQNQYKAEAVKTMSQYVTVTDTPEMHRVRENQRNISTLQYTSDLKHIKGKVTTVKDTPEILRAKENQKNFSLIAYKEEVGRGTSIKETPEMERVKRTQEAISSIKYKDNIGQGTAISDLPEVKRVKETQKNISTIKYKESVGQGTAISDLPEVQRVKETQKNISSIKYKESIGQGTAISDLPEVQRVKETQKNISSIKYKESVGQGTAISDLPEVQRVKETQKNISSIKYKESVGQGTAISDLPEVQRVKQTQKNISAIMYKENVGQGTAISDLPEVQRVKETQKNISSIKYKENVGQGTAISDLPEVQRVKETQKNISSIKYKDSVGQGTAISDLPEVQRVKETQKNISSIKYKESIGKGTAISDLPEVKRVKETQKNISSVLYKENLGKGTAVVYTPEMQRVKRNQENISSVLYSDSFRKQVQGRAAYVLDTPEMRRVRDSQRNISTVKYHEDFEKTKGSFTPVVTDPITERVKKNMQDFSDISYRGIQRRVVEMQRRRVENEGESLTDLRVWRTNPGSVFDYDPAEDNIQSRSLHMLSIQAQRRSREHSRSASALSLSGGDEKSELSEPEHTTTYYNGNNFFQTSTTGYQQTKTTVLPQQRSSSVATQQTTVSSIPSHPSTTGKTYRAIYDYSAADADEVSFKDGDVLMNVQPIDEGWMYGTVQRTGLTGMLPANYVDAI